MVSRGMDDAEYAASVRDVGKVDCFALSLQEGLYRLCLAAPLAAPCHIAAAAAAVITLPSAVGFFFAALIYRAYRYLMAGSVWLGGVL